MQLTSPLAGGGGAYTALAASGVQRILLGGSGATYSQTGTLVTVTLTAHGLTAAADDGSSVYLTQSTGALLSGWFTNLTYVNANSFTCTSTVSQSTSGNLGSQTGEITVETLTMRGGALGLNGELAGWFLYGANANNANAKTLRLKVGGTTVLNPSLASTLIAQTPFRLQNRGSLAKQVGYGTASASQNGSTTAALNYYTVDTSADVTLLVTMQLATATDHMKLAGYSLDLRRQA